HSFPTRRSSDLFDVAVAFHWKTQNRDGLARLCREDDFSRNGEGSSGFGDRQAPPRRALHDRRVDSDAVRTGDFVGSRSEGVDGDARHVGNGGCGPDDLEIVQRVHVEADGRTIRIVEPLDGNALHAYKRIDELIDAAELAISDD